MERVKEDGCNACIRCCCCIVWCLYDRVSASYEEEWQDQFHGAGTGRVKKVKDTKGFIEFLYWREMLFGALVLIVGVLGVLNETVMPIGKASILEVIIFLAAFIWFQNSLAKAREKFLHL